MSFIPLIGALSSIASSWLGYDASNRAAEESAAATRYAADLQRKNFTDAQGLLQPSINAGNTARDYQLGSLGLPGGVDRATAEAAFRTSPGYDFALKTGNNQAQTSAASGGRLFSGKTLKDLTTYGQGMADQQYGNWYNRLSGISGGGQTATGQMISTGTNTAGNLGMLATNDAANRGSSYVAGANAITSGIQNLSDLYSYYGKNNNKQSTGWLY
jgi:hypothetical protein